MKTQEVIDGVIKAIRDNDLAYRVYTESVEQGLKVPCFSIRCINSRSQSKFNTRVLKTYMISISYFPQSDTDARTECMDVWDVLSDALDTISVGNSLVHCKDEVEYEIVDDVLVCTATYELLCNRTSEDGELMETLRQEGVISDGDNEESKGRYHLHIS